jgi:hypothetical protein
VADRDFLLRLQKQLADEGKLIEAGWVGFRLLVVAKDASATQLSEMKLAFFAGCEHLFTAMMGVLEEGEEPTDADLKRMDLIHTELAIFRKTLETRVKGADRDDH